MSTMKRKFGVAALVFELQALENGHFSYNATKILEIVFYHSKSNTTFFFIAAIDSHVFPIVKNEKNIRCRRACF